MKSIMKSILVYLSCRIGGAIGRGITGQWWGVLLGGFIGAVIVLAPFEFLSKSKKEVSQ